jgi:hypothetical protein
LKLIDGRIKQRSGITIIRNLIHRTNAVIIIAATFLLAGLTAARADYQIVSKVTLTNTTQTDNDARSAPPVSATPATPAVSPITIEMVELSDKKQKTKVVAWFGLAVEESSEALSSQLGLKTGQGLTVIMIAEDSPALKAEFCKNDVLVELDGQMLVHPIQLRKLVQMHAEGDTINLTFFRGGKKQTTSVKLGKTSWPVSSDSEELIIPGHPQNFQFEFKNLDGQMSGLDGQLRGLDGQFSTMRESLAHAGLDKDKLNMEIKHTMDQTRKAIEDAVQHASKDRKSLSSVYEKLDQLARDGVDVDNDATVIIRNKRNTSRTMVQTDDSGSYIIETGKNTHLTARDKNGKLLFDGEIDTPAEKEKVPKNVWEKVAPMLDQMTAPEGGKPKTQGKIKGESEILKQIAHQRVLQEWLM